MLSVPWNSTKLSQNSRVTHLCAQDFIGKHVCLFSKHFLPDFMVYEKVPDPTHQLTLSEPATKLNYTGLKWINLKNPNPTQPPDPTQPNPTCHQTQTWPMNIGFGWNISIPDLLNKWFILPETAYMGGESQNLCHLTQHRSDPIHLTFTIFCRLKFDQVSELWFRVTKGEHKSMYSW